MTDHTSPGQEVLSLIQRRIALLEARNGALKNLSRVSEEMRSRLRSDPAADIKSVLSARERECRKLASLATPPSGDWDDQEAAQKMAQGSGGEAGALANTAVALQSESDVLAEEILQCQRECESLLKTRLKAAARALRESRQRRKLDAAYGPACSHSTPVYLDKQQ